MGFQIETIRALGEFEEAADAIGIFSLCEARGQDNQIGLFLIGLP
jgi:hypothetical protein